MKKATLALSALAVAATVSTALAHTRAALNTTYCVAYDFMWEDGNYIPYPYPYMSSMDTYFGPCTFTAAFTVGWPNSPFTTYGYIKTTPAGWPCQYSPTCPAIRVIEEI